GKRSAGVKWGQTPLRRAERRHRHSEPRRRRRISAAHSEILRCAQRLRRNPERGGAEGRKRRIFGHTGRTWPNCTDRTIGRAARPVVPPALGGQRGSGVTKDPSLPPLGPTLAQDFFTAAQDDGGTRMRGVM